MRWRDALAPARLPRRRRRHTAAILPARPQLHAWFLASRDPDTGDYADLPEASKGGSRDVVHPPPPPPSAEEAAAAAKAAAGAKAASSKGGKGGKGGAGGGGEEAPQAGTAFLRALREAVQEYLDVWQEHEPADPTLALRECLLARPACPWALAGLTCRA